MKLLTRQNCSIGLKIHLTISGLGIYNNAGRLAEKCSKAKYGIVAHIHEIDKIKTSIEIKWFDSNDNIIFYGFQDKTGGRIEDNWFYIIEEPYDINKILENLTRLEEKM